MEIAIRFGASAPTIEEQLSNQSVDFDADEVERFQARADAITTLHLSSTLADAEAKRARERLMVAISRHVQLHGE